MENKEKVIQELSDRIEQLTRQQAILQEEIRELHADLNTLKITGGQFDPVQTPVAAPPTFEIKAELFQRTPKNTFARPAKKSKTHWEEFIGANLLNKAGIAVLVLGIGFGAKYSVDHGLFNPLTRMIIGYLAGITLIGFAYRLKESHKGFSAVLLSGGMAVLYFMTYAANSFYGLIPLPIAFVMMVLLTFFTVFAALRYDLEIIGVIGLVGAYAVPLLLSNGSGRVEVLFSYISIINAGILFLAFRKYWNRLYYLAFFLTWVTFGSWYAFSFDSPAQVPVSLIFSAIFFLIFYTTFLGYKLIRRKVLGRWDVTCMLLNSFVFFGYGYLTIESLENGSRYLGLFTVLTALMHLAGSIFIYKKQGAFNDVFYLVTGMVLVFLTLAVPVQLDANWVTLVWAAEAALLFWIGRSKSFPSYEKLSYPLIALAFISLLHDWNHYYPGLNVGMNEQHSSFRIFLNVQFLTSLLVGGAFVFIFSISKRHPGTKAFEDSTIGKLFTIGLPLLTMAVFFMGFFKEIEAFWNARYTASRMVVGGPEDHDQYNDSLLHFKDIWLILYSAVFASLLCWVQRKWPTRMSGFLCLTLNSTVLFIFITVGLMSLRALRTDFLEQNLASFYDRGYGHIFIRYAAILSMAPVLWFNRKLARQEFYNADVRKADDLFFHFVVLVLLSSELIHWLDLTRTENSFKLSLTILWGAYALFLIVKGLFRNQKHIRLAAIAVFAAALLKLFAYDMADMSTILKTVVMIVLGILLLTASFVYNKHNNSPENESR